MIAAAVIALAMLTGGLIGWWLCCRAIVSECDRLGGFFIGDRVFHIDEGKRHG
jgi:hypothetical protein